MRWPLHVDYVTDPPTAAAEAVQFLLATLSEPTNAALFVGGGLVVLLGVVTWLRVAPTVRDFEVLRVTLDGYRELVPWMLRLAVGLPTLGAGFAGYYFSPNVILPGTKPLLVAVGFLLLVGLATRTVAIAGLVLWVVGLAVDPAMLLALEYPLAFVAIALLGGGTPSADELLARVAETPGTLYSRVDPIRGLATVARERIDPYARLVPTVLRVGLGATFVYLGLVEKLLDPARALQVVAKYDLTAVVPVDPGVWVLGAGLVEIGLGLALVAGLFTRASAALAFVVLTTTLFGLPDDPVLAHVSLFGLSSAVFTLGGGPLSLDRWLGARRAADRAAPTPAD
ncbi:DoxX family protein [Halorarius litoreus]|uniref:DoxX family protein n=1 Tax=Halorarius litoreus TaxID=2962676 RepID=UPI0020CD63EF|nr:DoxX family protein [Halorarius litoreus]